MINRQTAERVLDKALEKGGDFSELYLEDGLGNALTLLSGRMEEATTSRIHGAGVRVLAGLGSVYVHTCDTTEDGLMRAAVKAADAVRGAKAAGLMIVLNDPVFAPNLHPARKAPYTVEGARKAEWMRSAYQAAKAVDDAVSQVKVTLTDGDKTVTIINSDGRFVSDRRVRVRLGIQVVASDGHENQIGFEGPGALQGYEVFERDIDVVARAQSAARTAVTMLRAEECPAGEMPVVIGGGFGGVIFHEACGHSLEATAVALGNSEFCGKMNQTIASDVVTAIDDGTIPGAWGSLNIDDEGEPTNRLVLIEKGVLKNFMVDKLNGRRMGMPTTGSARRQGYMYQPTSRMRNTFIAPGDDDEEAMIATMGDGLYAAKMGGGSVNPVTGEFNFAVGEGYLVRGGKIEKPVRGATLIGRGSEALMRIDRVGRAMTLAEGMCGSESGSVPVTVGQPRIRISRMTVGGRS